MSIIDCLSTSLHYVLYTTCPNHRSHICQITPKFHNFQAFPIWLQSRHYRENFLSSSVFAMIGPMSGSLQDRAVAPWCNGMLGWVYIQIFWQYRYILTSSSILHQSDWSSHYLWIVHRGPNGMQWWVYSRLISSMLNLLLHRASVAQ